MTAPAVHDRAVLDGVADPVHILVAVGQATRRAVS